jgi:hypothetical protein
VSGFESIAGHVVGRKTRHTEIGLFTSSIPSNKAFLKSNNNPDKGLRLQKQPLVR